MSLDFGGIALQIPEDEEEYEQDHYERQEELQKLLANMDDDDDDDDVLDDSVNSIVPEPDLSICSQTDDNRHQNAWTASQYDDSTHPQQVIHNNGAGNSDDHYRATYHPHQPANEPQMFRPQVNGQNGPFDQLQREFLDSAQGTIEGQKLAQLQVLHKAQSRQKEELEKKLEDSMRRTRYLEHQFQMIKDEKDGLVLSLKESNAIIEEAKATEDLLQERVRALEKQIQSLSDSEQEAKEQQRLAQAEMESMQQQMRELCSSETLARARKQHDRDTAIIKEQYKDRFLTLQQQLDLQAHSLAEQTEAARNLQEQVRQLERQREEDQVDRASIINSLTQRLEESQQQCAKLLYSGSVQEVTQLKMELQQTQKARTMSEELNKALQMEVKELKEQINLYESTVKYGALASESNGDLSESYMNLGISKSKWRIAHSSTSHKAESAEAVRELQRELQICLNHLKSKDQKLSKLEEDLRISQSRAEELQMILKQREELARDSEMVEKNLPAAPQKDLVRLLEEQRVLQERVESLEKNNQGLKLSEEKVKTANLELCTNMRQMIHDIDQEKLKAAKQNERIQSEHIAQINQLSSQHQHQIERLESFHRTHLAELSQEMATVQESYISVCGEKDKLEEEMQTKLAEERKIKEDELKRHEESVCALRSDLQLQHQEEVARLKARWETDTQAEIELRVKEQLETARQSWHLQQEVLEKSWTRRLQEAEEKLRRPSDCEEEACQTSFSEARPHFISLEEMTKRLRAQRETIELEAVKGRARAVEEAVKQAERALQKKNSDISLQLEQCDGRNKELQEKLLDLASQLERSCQDRSACVKAELATAREEWIREKQEEISCLTSQLQKEQTLKLQVISEQNDQCLKWREKEEAFKKNELELKCQHEIRLQKEREQVQEELLTDLKEVLHDASERIESQNHRPGTMKSRVWEICKDTLSKAFSQVKKTSEKISDELVETQEHREAEKGKMQHLQCRSLRCAESLAMLQKKYHELQKHLEKACHQLRKTVKDHKSSLQKTKDEHADALQKEKESRLKVVEELKQLSSNSVSKDHLKAGLEELRDQYMQAMKKIRADVVQYLKESRQRAAEEIRREVQREKHETTKKMRMFYLTCLQEMLEDGGQTAGAEKHIINAASKLAAMAKGLETPMSKPLARTHKPRAEVETIGSSNALGAASMDGRTHQVFSLLENNEHNLELETLKLGLGGQMLKTSQKCIINGSEDKTPNATLRKQSREFSDGFKLGRSEVSPVKHFLIEDAPVRDEVLCDWSLSSNGTSLKNPYKTTSYPEPRQPVSANDFSPYGFNFGNPTDDFNLSSYKSIVPAPSHGETTASIERRKNKVREAIPGSGEKRVKLHPKNLFSDLKRNQQDSGFNSPFLLLQK